MNYCEEIKRLENKIKEEYDEKLEIQLIGTKEMRLKKELELIKKRLIKVALIMNMKRSGIPFNDEYKKPNINNILSFIKSILQIRYKEKDNFYCDKKITLFGNGEKYSKYYFLRINNKHEDYDGGYKNNEYDIITNCICNMNCEKYISTDSLIFNKCKFENLETILFGTNEDYNKLLEEFNKLL
jgi:hypothetical protein